MKLKLKAIHIFIILFMSLIFCCGLGSVISEGMTNNTRTATVVSGNNGKIIKGPNNTYVVSNQTDPNAPPTPAEVNNYNTQGITASQIPKGQEDLYILKSQVVPPVCPACPAPVVSSTQEKCPPCPACARCPEPDFTCKKVPNYNSIDKSSLPVPMLSDFSMFGM